MAAAPALLSGVFFPVNTGAHASNFSAPPHPSVRLLKRLHSEKQNDDNPVTPPRHSERDPHEQPTFTAESLAHPTEPVLYLPPLISSLPIHAQHPPTSTSDPTRNGAPAVLTTSTRLPDIDPVSLSLHRALHYFRPLDEKYASRPYDEAFNWSELRLPEDEEREWYCVAFRSRRKQGSDGDGEKTTFFSCRAVLSLIPTSLLRTVRS